MPEDFDYTELIQPPVVDPHNGEDAAGNHLGHHYVPRNLLAAAMAKDFVQAIGRCQHSLNELKNLINAAAEVSTAEGPPELGTYFLYLLLSSRDREVIAREMEEVYVEMKARFGYRKAAFWYWTRVVGNVVAYWQKPLAKLASVSGLSALLKQTDLMKNLLHKVGLL